MKLLRHFFLLLLILWFLTNPVKISAAENLDATLEKINKSSLPLGVKITPILASPSIAVKNGVKADTDTKPVYNSASQYTIATSLRVPTPAPSNLDNFFSNLFKGASDFFANLIGFGNKKATQFAGTTLPQEAVNKNLTDAETIADRPLTQADNTTQVLGITSLENSVPDSTAMKKALPLLQCANLPYGVGDCAKTKNPIAPEVNCDQAAPDISISKMIGKEAAYDLALRWSPGLTDVKKDNHVRECYNDVVRRAQNAGVNPAFALMIWINESNGSNYDISLQDFGINLKSLEGDFNKQIERFLQLPKSYKANYAKCFGKGLSDMEVFAYIFRVGYKEDKEGKCVLSDQDGLVYYTNILDIWNWFAHDCPLPSYPTDTSCP